MSSFKKRLLIGLFILALLSPLGIILPEVFKAGDAWGEWDVDALKEMLGFIPEGMRKLSDLWKAPIPDYNLGGEEASLLIQVLSYILSGILGILLAGGIIYIFGKMARRRRI
ncbi:MAG: hypothetical protein N2257_06115 [Thermodesulfovibrionales bacterium]|nr:hypothetical protein [Thermodesulfovibrionales bacterium]